ncbi:MD-2-related lipid-recognition protein-like [Maniola hyperantus]|uniref:MD-2-related lipid-recognition protein-like n=1 Tax=Aphantopus hyperantus TaxID=2795564 RepID=UPI0015688FD6|nr:MD-2-related lipid-recognition protein-like [Maniola hyperantus]
MLKMAVYAVLLVALCFSVVNSEYVNRKFCPNVDPSKCSIHSVKLDPCADGPGFCLMRREKPYRLSFDFTPRFEAQNLQLSLHSDDDNSGNFKTVIMPAHDACVHQTCPLEDNVRTMYDVDFVFLKKVYGKFPIQMKLWNGNNESEACCFTFSVKTLK